MKLTDTQRERVLFLADEHGRVTPSLVLEDARREDSPLHGLFEWNNDKAAEQHRLDTARAVIRTVKVVVTIQETTIKAPHYVRDPDAKGQGYRSVEALQRDPVCARQALIDELTRAAGVVTRAKNLATVLNLSDEVDYLLGQILGLQNMLQADVSAHETPAQPS